MQTDLLTDDVLNIETSYTRANTSKRLGNYLIDLVSYYVFIFAVSFLAGTIAPETTAQFFEGVDNNSIADRIVTLIFYALYLGAMEAFFKGKTLGKFITKTRAVNEDGSQITTSTAFARGFSRAVPFCAFSALGTPCNPWHDRWTKTYVVEEELRQSVKRIDANF